MKKKVTKRLRLSFTLNSYKACDALIKVLRVKFSTYSLDG